MTDDDREELLAQVVAERFQVPRKAVRVAVDRGTAGPDQQPEPESEDRWPAPS